MTDPVEVVTEGLIAENGLFREDVDYREVARVALRSLEAAGYRVVPVEPTEAMSDAGAIHPTDYAAMLAAAPKVTP